MATRASLQTLRNVAAGGPPYADDFLASLQTDSRAGARALYERCRRRIERAALEEARIAEMMRFERQVQDQGFARVAGVDEAGRGPLAGPIVAGAVVLAGTLAGLDDSKRLTPARREKLYEALMDGDHGIGVAVVDSVDVDCLGIQSANYVAMAQAVARLSPPPDFVLVDGFVIRGCRLPQKAIVKGDRKSMSIAAASIIAKVTRDRIMERLDAAYPGYGFTAHKGYGTAEHLDALRRLGPCPVHRRSFAPVAGRPETALLFQEEGSA